MAKKKMKDLTLDFLGDDKDYEADAIDLSKKAIVEVDEEKEVATSGSPEEVPGLRPEIIAEARKLAGSKKGLDIAAFFKKYNFSYNIETLLHAPLDEDGNIL